MFMTLETFPAEDVHPAVAGVHPCMLHLVRMGNGKRHSWLEPVPTKIHWRQTFEIQGDKDKKGGHKEILTVVYPSLHLKGEFRFRFAV